MFTKLIPLAIAAMLSTGGLVTNVVGLSSASATGPCPTRPVESTSTPTSEPGGRLDDRCAIDPEAYYLEYESPVNDTESQPTTVNPGPMTSTTSAGAPVLAASADQVGDVIPEPPQPPPPPDVPGPLDDNVFVDSGDSLWVKTDSDRESTFALDVDTGSFSVAQQFLAEGYVPEPESIRPEEWINSFTYGDEPASDGDLAVHVDSTNQGPDGTSIVRVGITAAEIDPIERPAANITFVVDTSGSMDIRERLGMVQASLALLVKNLRPDDTIAIITYGDQARPVLAPTPVSEWRDIVAAIDTLVPNGSTNMEAGLLLGYEQARQSYDADEINTVVLASDGVANVGVTDADVLTEQITQAGEDGVHLVTVGYGMGNYNDFLMEQLADQGDGFYSYVDTYEEAERLFVDELTPTLFVVAEQAKVQVVFDADVVAAYRLIGYENRALDDEEFTDDTVDAGELGAGHQVSALYELELIDGAAATDVAGEVRLRWQPTGGGETAEVREVRQNIVIGDDEPSSSLQLAAVVAYTAELLKGNSVVTERGLTLDTLYQAAKSLEDDGVDGAAEIADFLETVIELDQPIFPSDDDD